MYLVDCEFCFFGGLNRFSIVEVWIVFVWDELIVLLWWDCGVLGLKYCCVYEILLEFWFLLVMGICVLCVLGEIKLLMIGFWLLFDLVMLLVDVVIVLVCVVLDLVFGWFFW